MPAARRVARWLGAGIVVAAGIAAALWVRACNRVDAPPAPLAPRGASDPRTSPATQSDAMAAAMPESAPGLVDAARVAAAAGRHAEALALYQRAQGLEPRAATLLEIGRTLHRMGRCREAWRATQGALASSPEPHVAAAAQQLLDRIGRCD
jgi:tetratricopeptide (TPR) repeat protein